MNIGQRLGALNVQQTADTLEKLVREAIKGSPAGHRLLVRELDHLSYRNRDFFRRLRQQLAERGRKSTDALKIEIWSTVELEVHSPITIRTQLTATLNAHVISASSNYMSESSDGHLKKSIGYVFTEIEPWALATPTVRSRYA